jgi:filamentous hemagglutinin family protein
VQNIISRVTGGRPSSIDGTLRSTIPNADLYFLNPYGIMFGPNAKLDVQGGFHVSTADYLRLQDGGRFEARYPNQSLLTVAPVAAFGFLTETPAAIKVQDSQLEVPKGKTLSLIGGDLELNASTPPVYLDDSTYNFMLFAESGRLDLASVASRGEVIPTPLGLDLQPTTKGGPITLTNALLSVSGDEGNGNVFIRGGHFQMTQGWIENNTATQAGGVTDVQVENLTFREEAGIDTSTLGTGPGGSINLKVTDTLTLMTGGSIHVNSIDKTPQAGNSGNLTIQARQVNLSDGADIGASAFGTGHGGMLHLQVSETLNVTNGMIDTDSFDFELENAGNAGNLTIQARDVNLAEGAQISSSTFGTGQGGTVHLQVLDTLTVSGEHADGHHSGVFVSSEHIQLANAGAAGNLEIEARQIILRNGGKIDSGTYGTGQGGMVHLHVSGTLTVTGQDSHGYPSVIAASSLNEEDVQNDSGEGLTAGLPPGEAGSLLIQANTISLTERGKISTQTNNAGGGDITLLSPNLLYLRQGEITTSVKGGKSNGGNITINNPVFVILAKAKIVAQADEGKGGNITIRANQFIATPPPDSLVSASSKLGIDGQVVIASPNPDISSKLFLVSTEALDVSSQLKRPCGGAKTLEEIMNPRFKFYVYPIAGSRQSFEDWGPSPLPSRSAKSSSQGKTGKGAAPGRGKSTETVADRTGYQPVVLVVECPKAETWKAVAEP